MIVLRDRLYQVVVVPVLAPLPVAWVAIGFKVDDAVANILRGPMRFHVSLLSRHAAGRWRLQASTLDTDGARAARCAMSQRIDSHPSMRTGNAVYDAVALTRVLRLPRRQPAMLSSPLLQEPLAAALEPFHRLQRQLALISLVAVIMSDRARAC